jgi:hypothetical protein
VSSFAIDPSEVIGIQVGGVLHRVSSVAVVHATIATETAPLSPGQCVVASISVYGQPPERLVVPLEQVQAYLLKT